MDSLHSNRAQLAANMETILDTARRVQQDRATGQGNLFDSLDDNGKNGVTVDLPHVRDWPDNEKLFHEKEVLGIYISGHPLAKYESEIRSFACASINSLNEKDHSDSLSIVGVIYNLKVRTSKNGKRFAVGMVEDMEGTIEAVFIPNTFAKYESLITTDEPVMLRGKADFENDVAKNIIVMEVKSLREIRRDSISAIHIKLDLVGLDESTLTSIKSIIERNSGECPVLFHVTPAGGEGKTVRAHRTYNVNPSDILIRDLSGILGNESIRYSIKGCQ